MLQGLVKFSIEVFKASRLGLEIQVSLDSSLPNSA